MTVLLCSPFLLVPLWVLVQVDSVVLSDLWALLGLASQLILVLQKVQLNLSHLEHLQAKSIENEEKPSKI